MKLSRLNIFQQNAKKLILVLARSGLIKNYLLKLIYFSNVNAFFGTVKFLRGLAD